MGARLKKYERESRRRPPERGFRRSSRPPGSLRVRTARVAPGPLHPRRRPSPPCCAHLLPPASASGHGLSSRMSLSSSLSSSRSRSRPRLAHQLRGRHGSAGPSHRPAHDPPPNAAARSPPVLAQCPDAQLKRSCRHHPPRAPTLVLGIGRRGHAAGPGWSPSAPPEPPPGAGDEAEAPRTRQSPRRAPRKPHLSPPVPHRVEPCPAPRPASHTHEGLGPLHLGPRLPVHSPRPSGGPARLGPSQASAGDAQLSAAQGPALARRPERGGFRTCLRPGPLGPPRTLGLGCAFTGSGPAWKPLVLPALLPVPHLSSNGKPGHGPRAPALGCEDSVEQVEGQPA